MTAPVVYIDHQSSLKWRSMKYKEDVYNIKKKRNGYRVDAKN